MFGVTKLDKEIREVSGKRLFGRETAKVEQLCQQIKVNKLEGSHIIHPAVVALHREGKTLADVIRSGNTVTAWRAKYVEDHPEEIANYKASLKEWGNVNHHLFVKLYGIAKACHCNIECCGTGTICEPDRFLVRKNGTRYLIQC